jgi:hypothetical protein
MDMQDQKKQATKFSQGLYIPISMKAEVLLQNNSLDILIWYILMLSIQYKLIFKSNLELLIDIFKWR